MQVKTTTTTDVRPSDLAEGLALAGPDVFADFMLHVFKAWRDKKVDLDAIAKAMAPPLGSGRTEVFREIVRLIDFHQEANGRSRLTLE